MMFVGLEPNTRVGELTLRCSNLPLNVLLSAAADLAYGGLESLSLDLIRMGAQECLVWCWSVRSSTPNTICTILYCLSSQ